MSLDFWDGVLIASMFWFIIASICLLRGYIVGALQDFEWSAGYEAGWKAATTYYELEIEEKERGLNI